MEKRLEDLDVLKRKTVYLAGPMSGLKDFNAPAFTRAATDLRQRGYRVINPVELDQQIGFDPWVDKPEDFDLPAAIRRDVDALLECDAIVMLPGHETSKGATAERHIAIWRGLEVLSYPSMVPLDEAETALEEYAVEQVEYPKPRMGQRFVTQEMLDDCVLSSDDGGFMPIGHEQLAETERLKPQAAGEPEDILLEAHRITRGDRNISYGPPDADFTRTAGLLTSLFADKLKDGQKFESWEVAQLMICLKLSRLRHAVKRDSIVDIAGYARCMDVCYTQADAYGK